MPAPLSDATRKKIRELRARGKPIAAVAAELGVSTGVVHKVCSASSAKPAKKPTAGRARRGRAAPATQPPRAPQRRRAPPAEPAPSEADADPHGDEEPGLDADPAAGLPELAALIEAEGGDADLGMISLQVARCEGYLTKLREAGNYQAVVQVERLIADLVERRRKLRPPPPPDPEELALVRIRERDELVNRIMALVSTAEAAVDLALQGETSKPPDP
jgi:hypothetical protein